MVRPASTCKPCIRRARIFPIVEVQPLVYRTTTPEEHKGDYEKPNHHDNFGRGEPELRFAVDADRKEIEPYSDDDEEGDPHRDRYRWVPMIDDKPRSGD